MSDYIGKICPYCKTGFTSEDEVVVCSQCEMPHHKECWIENQGCTTFGCMGTIKAADGSATSVTATQMNYDDGGYVFCTQCGTRTSSSSAFCTNCGNRLAATPAAPTYQTPAAPVYPTPAAPTYPTPAAPAYQAPAAPAYQAPAAPAYPTPAAPAYPTPAAPTYQAPAAPTYQAPAAPAFQAPVAPTYQAPADPTYQAPVTPTYQAPTAPAYPTPTYQAPTNPYGGYTPRSTAMVDPDVERLVDSNATYYIPKFRDMKAEDRKASWNWAAFWITPYWFFYRKMYGLGAAILGGFFLIALINSPFLTLMASGANVVFGIFANYIYMKNLENKAAQAKVLTEPARGQFFQSQGGTNTLALVLTMVGYAILTFTIIL